MKWKLTAACTALLLGISLCSCGQSPPPEQNPQELIEQIITYRGFWGDQADDKVSELLQTLEQTDPAKGRLWREITDYWDTVNSEMPVSVGNLPEDLPDDSSVALAVLGYALAPDGSMQDELVQRLETARVCAEQYPNAYVICTGGGTALNAPGVTEGGAMGAWMLANGLDPDRLIVEDQSLSTAENARNTCAILQAEHPEVDSVVIISSTYHIAWGALMFETVFLQNAAETGSPALHVIANCACPVQNDLYPPERMLRCQAAGLMQLAGREDLATALFHNLIEPPAL